MRLRHINFQVSDVDAAREFFEKFFGLRGTYQREKQIAFFTDETGFEFAVSNLFNSPAPIYSADFHAGSFWAIPVRCVKFMSVRRNLASR